MARFSAFQKHCTECREGVPCGKAHLYVMKLDPLVWEKKPKFRKANPHYDTGSARMMLYVGKTSDHVPRCRQSQHQRYDKENPKARWRCYCDPQEDRLLPFKIVHRPSTVVGKFTKGFFRPELFRDWNPIERGEVLERERELARHLIGRGYAVWAGDHSAKGLL